MSAENVVPITPETVATSPPDEATVDKAYSDMGLMLRKKILFGLSIYPAISPSMLHVFVGASNPVSVWKDIILEGLIAEGLVVREDVTLTSPHERSQTYPVLRLATTAYPLHSVQGKFSADTTNTE